MTENISREQTAQVVRTALRGFASDSELSEIADDDKLRQVLELDSLDFLTFVERLSSATGIRIDEDDYDSLASLGACVEFLSDTRR